MAYDFVAASSQYLTTLSSPVSQAPATIAMFLSTNSTSQTVFCLQIANAANGSFLRLLSVAASDIAVAANAFINNVSSSSTPATGVPFSNIFHGAGAFASNTSRTAYMNGEKATENTTSSSVTGLDQIAIGARYSASWGGYFNGQAAEAAIWNVALTDDEVTSLAKGFKPTRVRPQSLVFYAPLVRDLQDLRGALTITNNNTATVAAHPRVY